MTRLRKAWQFVGYAVLALGTTALVADRAMADHDTPARNYACRPYHFETVVRYETRYEPVTRYVTRYDHCGRPYQVTVTESRAIRVPVKRVVKVWD